MSSKKNGGKVMVQRHVAVKKNDKLDQELLESLQNFDASVIDKMSKDKLEKVADVIRDARAEINPFSALPPAADKDAYMLFMKIEMHRDYLAKLVLTSMIGYLNRACDEWHVPSDVPVTPVYEFLQNPELLDTPKPADDKVGLPEGMAEHYEENRKWMERRVIVKQFLEEMFQFDPDVHVRAAYAPPPQDTENRDPERNIILTPTAKVATLVNAYRINKNRSNAANTKREANARKEQFLEAFKENEAQVEEDVPKLRKIKTVLKGRDGQRREIIKTIKCTQKEYDEMVTNKLMVLPKEKKVVVADKDVPLLAPKDYFDRQHAVQDLTVHDTVRNMIPPSDIYHHFLHYFETNYETLLKATTDLYAEKPDLDAAICPIGQFNSKEEATIHKNKYQQDLGFNVYNVKCGNWALTGPYKENRERLSMYGTNYQIFEEMFKRKEAEQMLGRDLVAKKVSKARKDNKAKTGGNDPNLKAYANDYNQFASSGITSTDAEEDDCPEDAIEVGVFRISRGGLDVVKEKFHTKAEAPEHMRR